MTFTEAAAEVLRIAGKPLHYKEITELAIEKNLLSHVGKSPEVTMGARLAALLKKEDKANPIVRVKPGVFALREWKEKKGKNAPAQEPQEEGEEVNALEVEAANALPPDSSHTALEDEEGEGPEIALSGEDALRADLAASGAELFDDEDDDDQPILGGPESTPEAAAADGTADGGRRRRRRRRRGRGRGEGEGAERASTPRVEGAAPEVAVEGAEAAPRAERPERAERADRGDRGERSDRGDRGGDRDANGFGGRPVVRERHQIMAATPTDIPLTDGDELSGRDLADAAVIVLASFDRNQGLVPVRNVVEALARRGRLGGDPALAAGQLSAALRADNLRRGAQSQRPRFRFGSQNRVALTDWSMNPDLVRLEQEALFAIEKYKEAARKTMLRKLQELPGHAFVELALLTLERIGMSGLRPIRRSGSPGGELHFAGVHRTGADEIRTAVVIRKDGREIGRERVTDLRGALHHYGPATAGWLITTGQVLSGAREEAGVAGAPPIALYDGLSFSRLLDENGVAVSRTTVTIGIPDMELLETLRGA
jgi:hypothetical protein